MAKKAEAYVDTSAFIALLDSSDTYHATFRRLFASPPALLTTPLVIAEGQGWFLKRFDGQRALQFIAFIEELAPLEIASMGSAEVTGAAALLRKFADQPLTLTDAAGLFLMKRHRLRRCWSTDRHLGLTGVPLAIHVASS